MKQKVFNFTLVPLSGIVPKINSIILSYRYELYKEF